jgi:SAM-dependent MidA family methyltransferase
MHRHVEDPLEHAGEVDLTAHVDFADIRRAGEAAGLRTLQYGTQAGFLVGVMRETLAAPQRFGAWDTARVRAFQTLTHPQHLGRTFRMLEQTRTC